MMESEYLVSFQRNDICLLKERGRLCGNTNQRIERVAVLISHKVDFTAKKLPRTVRDVMFR